MVQTIFNMPLINQIKNYKGMQTGRPFKNFSECSVRTKWHHTRKNTRVNTNEDLLHALLTSLDPLISTLRALPKKISYESSNIAKSLLIIIIDQTNDCDSSDNNMND